MIKNQHYVNELIETAFQGNKPSMLDPVDIFADDYGCVYEPSPGDPLAWLDGYPFDEFYENADSVNISQYVDIRGSNINYEWLNFSETNNNLSKIHIEEQFIEQTLNSNIFEPTENDLDEAVYTFRKLVHTDGRVVYAIIIAESRGQAGFAASYVEGIYTDVKTLEIAIKEKHEKANTPLLDTDDKKIKFIRDIITGWPHNESMLVEELSS